MMLVSPSRFAALSTMILLSACTSPPSTGPLLRVVEQALAAEQAQLQIDQQRNQTWYEAQRQSLTHGFEADLATQAAPDRDWLLEHTHVYVAAREALLTQQIRHDQQLHQRITNLTHARRAQQRALQLLYQQDQLLAPLTDWQRWAQQQLEDPQ